IRDKLVTGVQTCALPIFSIELGGALKNVFALAAGISDGLKLGDNSKAALVTRSLAELVRLGVAMGGNANAFYGLSGAGDLIVTCYSDRSRNHTVGERLGRGEPLARITHSMPGIFHRIWRLLPDTIRAQRFESGHAEFPAYR